MGVSMLGFILFLNTVLLLIVLSLQSINYTRLQRILKHLCSIDRSVDTIEEQYTKLGSDEEVLMLIEKIKEKRKTTPS